MKEPKYLTYARSLIGIREIKGHKHNPVILSWLVKLNAWWHDDETPWCGVFVAACLTKYNYKIPKLYMRARAWLDYGVEISTPCVGCLVIFKRGAGGHVGFVVARDNAQNLLVLGGNQGNEVNIRAFSPSRVLGYRLPTGYWLPQSPLPTISMAGDLSENEA